MVSAMPSPPRETFDLSRRQVLPNDLVWVPSGFSEQHATKRLAKGRLAPRLGWAGLVKAPLGGGKRVALKLRYVVRGQHFFTKLCPWT